MLSISSRAHLLNVFRILSSMVILTTMLGASSFPLTGMVEAATDPVIRLSSDNAPACSGDDAASCIEVSFTADQTHNASYVFDCSGSTLYIPVPITIWGLTISVNVPTPACSLFALGSTFRVVEQPPVGASNNIIEFIYTGQKNEGQFEAKKDYTYTLILNAHGRDYRDALEYLNLGTFDSFAEVTYQELDPNDDICGNAIPFNLPYSGNLEFSGDHDWQEIKSPVRGMMVLTMDVPEGKDYELKIWSDDCQSVWTGSQNGPGVDEQIVMPVDWRSYHVLVYGKTTEDFGAWYGVSASFSGDLDDNQCGIAHLFDLPINGNLEYSGDHDWQQIKSPVKGTMVLTLDVPPDKDYQLEIRNDACSAVWVLSQNGPGVDEQFIMPVDPVFYRIHVYGKTSADWGVPYSVSTLWDLDDNQWEKAVPFEAPYQGNLEYGGDEDWQRVQISHENSFLVLAVPEEKDYQLEIWRDDTKSQIGSSTSGSGVDEQIEIPQPGTYRVHVFGADPLSDFNAPYQVQIHSDEIAPASTVALAGNPGTNDWYRSNVEVSLTATDNPGGSGVQKIEYGFNTTLWNPFTGPWNVYADPVTISAEGHTHLVYRATDHARNVEPIQTKLIMIDKTPPTVLPHPIPPSNANGWYNTDVEVGFEASDFQSGIASLTPMNYTFTSEGVDQFVTGTALDNAGNSATFTIGNINIDKTPPVITLIAPQATDYLHSEAFDLIWSANDTLSGIETAFATLDSQAVSNGQTIDLFFLGLGQHSVALTAMDRAGNSAGISVTFNVTADINSLRAVTQHAYDLGWIEKQGAYNTLDARLRAALQNIERNRPDHARKQLLLFLERLDSQKGRTINQQAYDLLKADALYVLEHLQ